MTSLDGALPEWFLPRIAELLQKPSRLNDLQVSNIPGGSNNRVFRVEIDSDAYLVKWYFSAPEDPRDRLDTEWKFADFAWRHGLRCLVKPIACDPKLQLAIFEFVAGRRPSTTELNEVHIRAAIDFLLDLNRFRESSEAVRLPVASEACFTIAEHIDCIQRRVQSLVAACRQNDSSTEVTEFIDRILMPTANRVVESIWQQIGIQHGIEAAELTIAERILSPSDFGFHNALLDAKGQLRFFDFEYAGWDDPAKTVCDFFAQVEVPVPREYWSNVIAGISPIAGADLAWRAKLLQPLYLVKWCCIVLNPFMKIGRERRQFSIGRSVKLDDCLDKARRVLASMQ